MARPTNSVHMNLVLAAEVQSGRLPETTPVGFVRLANGTFETLFAKFDRETGAPVISDKGNSAFNARPQ